MIRDEGALEWRCIGIGGVLWHLRGMGGSMHGNTRIEFSSGDR